MNENYVIVRSDKAGVFFGKLANKEKDEITLLDCRKLYYWNGACAVEQIAVDGISEKYKSECKFTVFVPEMTILNCIQVIPCSKKATDCIKNISVWKK